MSELGAVGKAIGEAVESPAGRDAVTRLCAKLSEYVPGAGRFLRETIDEITGEQSKVVPRFLHDPKREFVDGIKRSGPTDAALNRLSQGASSYERQATPKSLPSVEIFGDGAKNAGSLLAKPAEKVAAPAVADAEKVVPKAPAATSAENAVRARSENASTEKSLGDLFNQVDRLAADGKPNNFFDLSKGPHGDWDVNFKAGPLAGSHASWRPGDDKIAFTSKDGKLELLDRYPVVTTATIDKQLNVVHVDTIRPGK